MAARCRGRFPRRSRASLLPFAGDLLAAYSGRKFLPGPRGGQAIRGKPKVPGSMAEESKAPQKPESSQSKETGAPVQPSAGGASLAPPVKPVAPAASAPLPVQVPLDNELTRRYRERFGSAILDEIGRAHV